MPSFCSGGKSTPPHSTFVFLRSLCFGIGEAAFGCVGSVACTGAASAFGVATAFGFGIDFGLASKRNAFGLGTAFGSAMAFDLATAPGAMVLEYGRAKEERLTSGINAGGSSSIVGPATNNIHVKSKA